MMKCLIVTLALTTYCAPSSAASPVVPFAWNYDADRSILEFYPATGAKFTEQGRDLVRLIVRATLAELGAQGPEGPTDVVLVVDCRSRQLAVSQVTMVGKDGAPTSAGGAFKLSDLKPPDGGTLQRFVTSLCDGELIGVQVSPGKSGWVHFVEGTQRALYFVIGSGRKIGMYRAVSVRLYELGSAQLPDGRRIDARDAVWVVDCERKLGALAYERAFARVGNENKTVETIGDEKAFANLSVVEVDKLTFAQAVPGSMQAQFAGAVCRAWL
jgi:hypothetical protein